MRVENWNMKFTERLTEWLAVCPDLSWSAPSSEGARMRLASGAHCLSFGSSMVESITGKDYYQEMASSLEYNTPKEAFKALRSLGFNSIDQLIGSIFPEKRKSYLIRGDLAIVPSVALEVEDLEPEELEGLRAALGVVDPPYVWVMGQKGIDRVPLQTVIKGYEVN